MPRITGAAVGIAGLAFIGLGTAGVGSVTGGIAHATTTVTCPTDTAANTADPDATGVPSGDACVNETDEGLTAAQEQANGVTNDCGNFGLVQNSTTDGWVFILPQGDSDGDSTGEGNTFVTVTAVFDTIGAVSATVTGPPDGQKAVVSAPAGSILLEAYATVSDDSGASDGDNTLFFQVTGVCVATGTTTTTTTTPTTTTTTTPTTTTTTTPTTTTTTTPTTTTTTTTPTTTTTSAASGSLNLTTTTSPTTTTAAGGVLGSSTTTPSTGADTEFGAGLLMVLLGGGLLFGSTGLGRRKRQ